MFNVPKLSMKTDLLCGKPIIKDGFKKTCKNLEHIRPKSSAETSIENYIVTCKRIDIEPKRKLHVNA